MRTLSLRHPRFPSAAEDTRVEFRYEAPRVQHRAEPDVFARHVGIPDHDQERLRSADITLVGAGGIGSWTALALVRGGATRLRIIEPDIVDRTNLARQFYKADQTGTSKALAIGTNLANEAMAGAVIQAVPTSYERAIQEAPFTTDVIGVLVDNNPTRLVASRWARQHGVPAVFTMLSSDGGTRCISFLQGPRPSDPCLWCAMPNLNPDELAPCVASIVTGSLLAASMTTYFIHRALMGWPDRGHPFNLHDIDLSGDHTDCRGNVPRRADCWVCAEFAEA